MLTIFPFQLKTSLVVKYEIHILYELKFSRWFYFRKFRESNPRENFHFNLCLFVVMTTSAKS